MKITAWFGFQDFLQMSISGLPRLAAGKTCIDKFKHQEYEEKGVKAV